MDSRGFLSPEMVEQKKLKAANDMREMMDLLALAMRYRG